jgi:hypothetical protein
LILETETSAVSSNKNNEFDINGFAFLVSEGKKGKVFPGLN